MECWKIRNSTRPQTKALQLCRSLSWSKHPCHLHITTSLSLHTGQDIVTGLSTFISTTKFVVSLHILSTNIVLIVYFNAFLRLFVLWLHTGNYTREGRWTLSQDKRKPIVWEEEEDMKRCTWVWALGTSVTYNDMIYIKICESWGWKRRKWLNLVFVIKL